MKVLNTEGLPDSGRGAHPDDEANADEQLDTTAWQRLPPICSLVEHSLHHFKIAKLKSDGSNLVQWKEKIGNALALLEIDQVLRCDIPAPKYSNPAYNKWRYWSGVAARWMTDLLEPGACMGILQGLTDRGLSSLDWAFRADDLILDIQRWADRERERVDDDGKCMERAEMVDRVFMTGTDYIETMRKDTHAANRKLRNSDSPIETRDTMGSHGGQNEAKTIASNAESQLNSWGDSASSSGSSSGFWDDMDDDGPKLRPNWGAMPQTQAIPFSKIINDAETLRLETIDMLCRDNKETNEWVSSVRNILKFRHIDILIDSHTPRPERGDEDYSRWKLYSLSVGVWLMKHVSAAFRDRIDANLNKAKNSAWPDPQLTPDWYADGVMHEILAIIEEGKSHNVDSNILKFRNLRRDQLNCASDYIHAVQEKYSLLDWQSIAPPPYFIMKTVMEDIKGEAMVEDSMKRRIEQQKPKDMTPGDFNKLCQNLLLNCVAPQQDLFAAAQLDILWETAERDLWETVERDLWKTAEGAESCQW